MIILIIIIVLPCIGLILDCYNFKKLCDKALKEQL